MVMFLLALLWASAHTQTYIDTHIHNINRTHTSKKYAMDYKKYECLNVVHRGKTNEHTAVFHINRTDGHLTY